MILASRQKLLLCDRRLVIYNIAGSIVATCRVALQMSRASAAAARVDKLDCGRQVDIRESAENDSKEAGIS
jgi:hypothetical protein